MSRISTPWWVITIIIILLPLSLPVIIISNIVIGIHFSIWTQSKTKHYRYQCHDETHNQQLQKYHEDNVKSFHHLNITNQQFHDALIKTFTINNEKIKLHGLLLRATTPSTKWMIIAHGWTENCYQVLNIAWYWRENGYNVCTYDARGHGNSTISITTIGINEKYDLHAIVNYITNNYQPTTFGLMGHSMGAATIIEYAKHYQPTNINFMIVDGTFTTLTHQYQLMVKRKYHCFPVMGIYGMLIFAKLCYGFAPSKCQPIANLDTISHLPLLVIHSTNDDFIIHEMGKHIYETKIKYETQPLSQLLLLDQAQHTKTSHLHYQTLIETTLMFAHIHTNTKETR
ncbi:alpha/beta hydrolase [Spiroplasma endosymbiont of Virgichneumon dumeticola]|uniref:alpha/beta hydrolase n=1 Tax=Spiroplasma endosymbiont of Virgichneumon dumeticola TaxID=3139323 RepID=UPI0035C928D5